MKVFRHGVGRGSSVINYVTDAKTPKRQHSPPEVLRGDPQQVKQLIDSTSRKWKYTSGVLSWAPGDKVTPELERELMDSFEHHAFAGMEADQYSILWVRHSHAGHHEVHFVIPRTELRSDKALNSCPPGWDKQYNPLCELWNRRNNWARPDEAKRARLVSPGVTIESYRSGTAAEIRTVVTDAILQGVEAGVISSRDDIVSELNSIGFSVPRKGKDYITIEIPQDDSTKKKPQRIRLKGVLYAESWNAAEQRLGLGEQTQSLNGRTDSRDTADNARRIAQLEQRVAEIHKARVEYNRKRFSRRSSEQCLGSERDVPKLTPNPEASRRDKLAGYDDRVRWINRPDISLVPVRERQTGRVASGERQTASTSQSSQRLADHHQQSGRSSILDVPQRDKTLNTPNSERQSSRTSGGLGHVRTETTNFADALTDARRTAGDDATPFGQGRQTRKRANNSKAIPEPLGQKLERCCSTLRKVAGRLQQAVTQQVGKRRKIALRR